MAKPHICCPQVGHRMGDKSQDQLLSQPRQLGQMEKDRGPKVPSVLCSAASPCTLGHMLSSCKEALDRFEWRHNNVVKYLHTLFSSQGLEGVEIFADLDGHRVNGVTIPTDLAMSAQKPDLVLIQREIF